MSEKQGFSEKTRKTKILMVCLGNICRSPLAEGILRKKINELGLPWQVDSAGTSGWHNGECPHKGSIDIAEKHGIDITSQRSRKFVVSDFDDFDLIIAMDSENYRDIVNLARNQTDREKVKILLNYLHTGSNMAVPDPYYTGNFEEVYRLIDEASDALIADVGNIDQKDKS